MSTVLVTGGTGFIGSHLIPELLADGQSVEVLTRDPGRAQQRLPSDVKPIESLAEASEPQAIINLAGESLAGGRWSAARKRELRDSRLRITRALIDFIGRCEKPPAVLVSGSAVGFYGARGPDVVDEDTPAGAEFQAQLCADWEAEAERAHAEYGVRVCRIRTGLVLGANAGALAQMLTPFKFGLGGRFGSGEQYMPWIHIRDEVGAIRFLLRASDCHGAFNLTAPHPVTNHEFTKTLARVLNRPAVFMVPAPVLKTALGEMARLVLTGQRAVPRALTSAGYTFEFTELKSALGDLLGG